MLSVLGFPVYGAIRNMTGEHLTASAERGVVSLADAMADLCREMDRTAFTLQADGKILPTLLQDDAYYALSANRELARIVAAGDISDIAVVYTTQMFDGTGKVYAASGTVSKSMFFEFFYRYNQWSLGELEQHMEEYIAAFFRPMEPVLYRGMERLQFMTYVVPLNRSGRNTRGIMLFMLNQKAIEDRILRANLPEASSILISDPQRGLLYAHNLPDNVDSDSAAAIPLDQDRLTLDGRSYYSHAQINAYNGLIVQMLLPDVAIAAAIHEGVREVLIFLFVGVICAIAVAAVLTVQADKPVRRLTHKARRLMPATERAYPNEFDLISDTLTHLENNVEQLRGRLHSQRGVMYTHLLNKLFEEKLDELDTLLHLLREDGIRLDGPAFRVLILRIDDAQGFKQRFAPAMRDLVRAELIELAQQAVLDSGLSGVGCDFGWKLHVALLLNGNCGAANTGKDVGQADRLSEETLAGDAFPLDRDSVYSLATRILHIAAQDLNLSLTIGISRPIYDFQSVSNAADEALEETDRRFMVGEGCIFCAGDPRSESAAAQEWANLEAGVLRALQLEEYDVCRQKLSEYIDCATRCSQSAHARQSMTLLLLSMRQTLHGMSPPDSTDWKSAIDAMLTLQPETITQLQEGLENLLDAMADGRQQLERSRNTALVGRAMAFLDGNISLTSLNIDLMADTLHVSAGHLSRAFKDQTHITPMHYLDAQRMQRARTLLRDTGMNITELLAACGYVDKSNFIRKFRKLYGMTPMMYRQSQQQESLESPAVSDNQEDAEDI
ncbi:hypothetical protein AGMMS49992_16930 [Clostridia bacterium]|nr:hypothetical protein AGMMS49992_16930 [Clostridia bacterium]